MDTGKLIVGIGASIFLVASSLYLLDLKKDYVSEGSLGRETAGTILLAEKDTQRKPAARMLWLPLKTSDAFYPGDILKTGSDSRLKIEVKNGPGNLELGPGSLIVIETESDKLSFNLIEGEVQVEGSFKSIRSGSKKVILQKAGSLSLSKNSLSQNVAVKTNKNTSVVIVDRSNPKEEIEIPAESVALLLDKQTQIQSLMGVSEKFNLVALIPSEGSLILQNLNQLRFEWYLAKENIMPKSPCSSIKLVINSIANKSEKISSAEIFEFSGDTLTAQIPMPPVGEYSYQVACLTVGDLDEKSSQTIGFKVLPGPALSAPKSISN